MVMRQHPFLCYFLLGKESNRFPTTITTPYYDSLLRAHLRATARIRTQVRSFVRRWRRRVLGVLCPDPLMFLPSWKTAVAFPIDLIKLDGRIWGRGQFLKPPLHARACERGLSAWETEGPHGARP